jgi:hypothetical protein
VPRILIFASLLLLPAIGWAGDAVAVIDQEKLKLAARCETLSFSEDFVTLDDLNFDQIDDAVTHGGGVTCNGKKGPECTMLGCPFRVYAGQDNGGFRLAAEVTAFSYHAGYRYGVKVIQFQLAAMHCGKTSLSPCTLTTRLHGNRLEIISKE